MVEQSTAVSDSVILTVFNRDDMMLVNTIRALRKNDLTDTEVIVVDDGSTEDYTELAEMFAEWFEHFRWERVSTLEDHPNAYHIDGHNNPAYVNNRAFEMARGDRIFWLSSDCMLTPDTLRNAREWVDRGAVFVPKVIDMDSALEFCGENRIWPMCWFVGHKREDFPGFDEEYIKGIAFEDNDFMASLALKTGKLVIDTGTFVYHQSHEQVAYSDDKVGFRASESYTKDKWGGVPWSKQNGDPLKTTVNNVGGALIMSVERRVPTQ